MGGIVSMIKFGRGEPEREASAQGSGGSGWGAAESPAPNVEPDEQTSTLPFPLKDEVSQTETSQFQQPVLQPPDAPAEAGASAPQPGYAPPAKIEYPKKDDLETTVISRGTVLENVTMKAHDQEVVVFGAVSGTIECSSFRLEKGGRFEGNLVTTKSIEIAGVVRASRLTSPEVRVIGSAVIGYGTLIVAQKYGQQLTARFDARVISDATLTDDERILVLDDPDQYLHLPPKIDGQGL